MSHGNITTESYKLAFVATVLTIHGKDHLDSLSLCEDKMIKTLYQGIGVAALNYSHSFKMFTLKIVDTC